MCFLSITDCKNLNFTQKGAIMVSCLKGHGKVKGKKNMTNTYYYSKGLQAVVTIENYTKKEMYEFLDNYSAQGCHDDESFGLLYKDGTIVIIDENNPAKKYAKRGLVAIVENNECCFGQWGDSYELDENGAVTISNEGKIIAENAYEVDDEYYTEETEVEEPKIEVETLGDCDGNGYFRYIVIYGKNEEKKESEGNDKMTNIVKGEVLTEEQKTRAQEMIKAGYIEGRNKRYDMENETGTKTDWKERFEARYGATLEQLIEDIDLKASATEEAIKQAEADKTHGVLEKQALNTEYGKMMQASLSKAQPEGQPQAPQIDFEPDKAVLRWYSDYNGKRYGTPWVGIYDNGEYCFAGVGAFIGNCSKGGALIVNEPRKGVIYAYGQKDHRGNNTEKGFALWNGHCFVAATRAGYESKEPLYSSPTSYVNDDIVQYVHDVLAGAQ